MFCFVLYKAVERLNIKPAFWKDLLTDEPFLRKDLITIQDPTSLGKFDFTTFYHLKKNLKVEGNKFCNKLNVQKYDKKPTVMKMSPGFLPQILFKFFQMREN